MKIIKILAVALSCFGALLAQEGKVDFNPSKGMKMETQYSTKESELGMAKLLEIPQL